MIVLIYFLLCLLHFLHKFFILYFNSDCYHQSSIIVEYSSESLNNNFFNVVLDVFYYCTSYSLSPEWITEFHRISFYYHSNPRVNSRDATNKNGLTDDNDKILYILGYRRVRAELYTRYYKPQRAYVNNTTKLALDYCDRAFLCGVKSMARVTLLHYTVII